MAKRKKNDPAGPVAVPSATAAGEIAVPSESSANKTPVALEGSLAVLAKLEELEFHSRASLERLAELALMVEDELKQNEMVSPLAEVYSAPSDVGVVRRAVVHSLIEQEGRSTEQACLLRRFVYRTGSTVSG
ncbi:MAG: hypothetical protein ABJA98_25785 [Acidobacteriota bacterium]